MEFDSLQLNTQLSTHLINSTAQQPVDNELVETALRTEDLISSRSLAQDFGFTGVPIKQAHSKLRNCFIGASVEAKDKSKPGSY